MEMMKPPKIDYSEYEVTGLEMADTGRRMYDTGGALGARHTPVLVEPGETIVSKTQNMASAGQGVTLNIAGDVYDGDNFAEKISLALPDALRNADLGGTL